MLVGRNHRKKNGSENECLSLRLARNGRFCSGRYCPGETSIIHHHSLSRSISGTKKRTTSWFSSAHSSDTIRACQHTNSAQLTAPPPASPISSWDDTMLPCYESAPAHSAPSPPDPGAFSHRQTPASPEPDPRPSPAAVAPPTTAPL